MFKNRENQLLDTKLVAKTLQCRTKLSDLKAQIRNYFLQTYSVYEKLFEVIKENSSYYTKPEPLRHPLIFYYGHTAAFFVNKFIDKGLIPQRINPSYERMFAVGVDEMDWDDLNECHYNWPSVQDARKFRQDVKQMVLKIIDSTNDTEINWNNDMWIILMGIEHERIHLETSAVIIRRLPIEQIQPLEWFKECPHSIKELNKIPINRMKTIKEFEKTWDRQKETAQSYGWDNEFGHKHIKTKSYSASQMLVSNGQYFQFYTDGGYSKIHYWSEEGQNWLKSTKTNKPLFWKIQIENVEESSYYLRTITQIIDMPWDWPVEVNNLEAQAFCNWKGEKNGKRLRLPTEDQYFAMRSLLKKDLQDWKMRQVGNINLEYWLSPNPVNMFEIEGFYDIIGNVWQHTVTPIYPFEGFEIHPNYEDFTTPTFDNRHSVIKGGSFISTGNQALYHSRYSFRRHFYQFAGFRYVESQNSTQVQSADIDQSDQSVQKALKAHFIEQDSHIQQIIKFIDINVDKSLIKKSLVAGCSVGRLPLELSKMFQNSCGIDYTARYFQMATRLLEQKSLKYRGVEIKLSDFNLSEQNYKKVHLYQMNPENTDPKKVNEIDFLIIDGLSLRKNTINKAISRCIQLCSKTNLIQLLIVENSSKNIFNKDDNLLRNNSFKLLGQCQRKDFIQNQQSNTKLSLFSCKPF